MPPFTVWLRDFVDILSPRHCAVCDCRLNSSEQVLCGTCLLEQPYCQWDDLYENPVTRLFRGRIPVEKGYSHIHYRPDSDSHRLLIQLKYNHRPDIARAVGRMMAWELQSRGFFDGIDGIIPVPLHWIRHWRRGYNQSMLLACGISEVARIPVLKNVVWRVRNNETQTSKTYDERMANVEDLFAARRVGGRRHVLLVDDVLTTGATLTACGKALVAANPDWRYSILTLAKA